MRVPPRTNQMEGKFVFAGNRPFVLQELMRRELDLVQIFVVPNSYLQRYLEARSVAFDPVPTKRVFVETIKALKFDYFIANGLPIILPVSEITCDSNKQLINVHPSYLPDLRGADPVPGALLHARDAGATCHLMNDGVDTGPIICRERIPWGSELEAGLLYQLSFQAEVRVIQKALDQRFEPRETQQPTGGEMYYSFSKDDLRIRFDESIEAILRRIRAFANRSKGAYFVHNNEPYRVFDAEIVEHPSVKGYFSDCTDRTVALNYENMLLVRVGDRFIKLKQIDKDVSTIAAGSFLS